MSEYICNLARHSTNKAELKELSKHKFGIVREIVAKNLHTPLEILERLSVDKDFYVQRNALLNPGNLRIRDILKFSSINKRHILNSVEMFYIASPLLFKLNIDISSWGKRYQLYRDYIIECF